MILQSKRLSVNGLQEAEAFEGIWGERGLGERNEKEVMIVCRVITNKREQKSYFLSIIFLFVKKELSLYHSFHYQRDRI